MVIKKIKVIMIVVTLVLVVGIIYLLYILNIIPHRKYSNSDFNINTYISNNNFIVDNKIVINNLKNVYINYYNIEITSCNNLSI